jgi:hypothetical protein
MYVSKELHDREYRAFKVAEFDGVDRFLLVVNWSSPDPPLVALAKPSCNAVTHTTQPTVAAMTS